ncbi:MAG: Cof-type HAD-IIB family hydrolase [Oscillospiraceae bacterium]|nr:Cof-type HAD-IIB family hydrolase [Oscillospiraceae bacterium]
MNKKVFASDFDGTLYFYRDAVKLPPRNVEMIRAYQAAGHLFGLCTGRQVGGLTPFISGLVAPDFYITSSGANIVDGQLRPIFRRGVDRGAADALVRRYRDDHRMTLDVEGEICVFAPMDYPGKYYVITGVDDAPAGLIHQVSIHNETLEEAAAVTAWVNENLGEVVTAFQNVVEVDIAPKGCSKGEGVKRLREWMRETWGDVTLYGIGDSNNDLPLLAEADVSYTFPYAPQALQDRAHKVVPTIVEALRDSMDDELQETP